MNLWMLALPMQFSLFTSYPGGQMHLKDPSRFWQVPGEQESRYQYQSQFEDENSRSLIEEKQQNAQETQSWPTILVKSDYHLMSEGKLVMFVKYTSMLSFLLLRREI